jgi:hypothetical protein
MNEAGERDFFRASNGCHRDCNGSPLFVCDRSLRKGGNHVLITNHVLSSIISANLSSDAKCVASKASSSIVSLSPRIIV